MVSMNPATTSLLTLLSKLRQDKAEAEEQWKQQQREWDFKIAAVETTLRLLGTNTNEVELKRVTASDLTGARTQMDALKKVARLGDGTTNATIAANLLLQAGLAKGKRRGLVSHLFNMMKSSDEWVKVAPGTFRLVENHEQAQP